MTKHKTPEQIIEEIHQIALSGTNESSTKVARLCCELKSLQTPVSEDEIEKMAEACNRGNYGVIKEVHNLIYKDGFRAAQSMNVIKALPSDSEMSNGMDEAFKTNSEWIGDRFSFDYGFAKGVKWLRERMEK